MHERSRHLHEALVLLLVVVALLPSAAAEPVLTDQAGGAKRVTWDFSMAADYNLTDVSVAPGIATLAQTPLWRNYTNDSDFLASEDSATNVSVSSGLRLVDQAVNLIQDGTFDQTSGLWTYANGATGQVLAARDAGGRARLWHLTPRLQFDSMDNVFGTHPWVGVGNGKSSSILGQSTTVRVEGSGSLRDNVTIGQQGGGNWVGAIRDDPGTWNWSAYNRLGVWINVNASGLAASILLTNLGGQNWVSWIPQSLTPGWHRYVFDISPSFGTNTQIDQAMVGFLGNLGKYTAHVDDLVLFNYTAFDERSNVSQTFIKPSSTSGTPGTLSLTFDVVASPSVNVVAYLRVSAGGFRWSESPVPAGTRTLALDLSADSARVVYQPPDRCRIRRGVLRCGGAGDGGSSCDLRRGRDEDRERLVAGRSVVDAVGSRRGVADHQPAEPVPPVATIPQHRRCRHAPRHPPLDPGGCVRANRDPPHGPVPPGGVGLRMGIVPRERYPASRHRDRL